MPWQTDGEWPQIPPEMWKDITVRSNKPLHVRDILPSEPQPAPRMHVWGAGGSSNFTFQAMRLAIAQSLRSSEIIHRGRWQTMDVSSSGQHATHELRNVCIFYTIPNYLVELQKDIQPDLPWAEEHLQERVSGEPFNPPPSYVRWPHHGGGGANRHIDDEVFSHTYPERFWPRFANVGNTRPNGRQVFVPHNGIRYEYGDLDGVVGQLVANPLTRQAVLPVWFPEDTGATDRRVPCSLAYHFMADDEEVLHCWYSIRACDFVRHFHNDVYFAGRLLQWVCSEIARRGGQVLLPGELNMTISSLHVFKGDLPRLP